MAFASNFVKKYWKGKRKGERARDDITQNLGDQKEKTGKEALKQENGSLSTEKLDQGNKRQTLPRGAENEQSRSKGGSQLSMSDHKSSYGQKDGDVEEAQASLDSTAQSGPKSPDDGLLLSLSYVSEGPCGVDLSLLDSSRKGDASKIKAGHTHHKNQAVNPSAKTLIDKTLNSLEPSVGGTADAAPTSPGSIPSGAVAASSSSLSSGAAATSSSCVSGGVATADHDAGDTSSDSITNGGAAVEAAADADAISSGSVSGGEAAAVDADSAPSGSVTEDGAAASYNSVPGGGEAAAIDAASTSSGVTGVSAVGGGGAPSSSTVTDGEVGGAAAAGSRNVGSDERAPIEEPVIPPEGVVAQSDHSSPSLTTPPIQEERPGTETADPTQNRTLEGGEEDLRNEETVTQGNRYEQLHISEEIQGNKFLEDMLVCKLDHTAHRCIHNWEHLACTQQVNAPLETRLRCKLISRGSCTRTLIDFLAVEKEDKSVQDLITALKNIRRNDVVKMIKEVYPDATDATSASQTKLSDFVASNANNDLIEKITTKLDERSRVNSCWMDLGRQFQLSGEKIKEIELCGESNPTEALMEYLHAKQPGLTVRTFYAKVEEIKRRDVLKKLKPVYDEGPEKPLWDGIKLDSNEMMSICVDLNSQNKALKNWRHLANALQVPRDTYTHFNPQQPKSPTKELLDWISTSKSDLKVGQLCDALESIGRNDVVRDLRNYFEQRPAGN